jgi:hypothetical protein
MAAYGGTTASVEVAPALGVKKVLFYTQDDADATNTIAITLASYGIHPSGLLAVNSWVHTTNSSVITTEANTTSVSSGVLTVTLAAGTNNDARVIEVIGLATQPDLTSA